jgi:phosphomannomutase
MTIRFGTDGWRGIIADDFTFHNLRLASQATADYFQTISDRERTVMVGFDVRFLSQRFAAAAAEVFAGNGFRVLLMDRPYPTPYVSFEVQRRGLVGGIVITASHNPAIFNGFKVKAEYGGSATSTITQAIEGRIGQSAVRKSMTGIDAVIPSGEYFAHLRSLVDWERIAGSNLRVVVDSMHGSGGRLLEEMLSQTTVQVQTIRAEPDPLFGGISPEPMMPQLEPLTEAVRQSGAAIGLATDGDADRLGVVSNEGRFVSTLQILPLLLLHAYRHRGWRGSVVHTFSQSQLIGRIATRLDLDVVETPIGFKHIAELMLKGPVLIGGEESGGIGLSRHLPERDGLFLQLLLLDLLATTGKGLTALIGEMWTEFGEFHYQRRDLHVRSDASQQLIGALKEKPPKTFARRSIDDIRTLDGLKLMLENDGWILFRRSGTEPVLRIYCEAPTETAVAEILEAGLKLVEQFAPSGVS